MTKEVLYTYLGTNGTITTPVHLEDIYYTRSIRLVADRNKQLTRDGGKTLLSSVIVPENEVSLWKEVDA
jgi:hypothetical protein